MSAVPHRYLYALLFMAVIFRGRYYYIIPCNFCAYDSHMLTSLSDFFPLLTSD